MIAVFQTPSPESSEEARFPIVAVHNDKPAADPPPPNSYEVSFHQMHGTE